MRSDLVHALEYERSAASLAEQVGDSRRLVRALAQEGMIAAVLGEASWRAALERGAKLDREGEPVNVVVGPALHRAVVLVWLDELDDACEILRSEYERAEERGEESALPYLNANLALAEFFAGRWEAASASADDGIEIAAQTSQVAGGLRALGVRALVRASRGDVDGARSDAERTLPQARERGAMMATMAAASALGVLELSLENAEAAHRELGPVVEHVEAGGVREPGSVRFVFDEVEALVGLGELEEAGTLLDRWEDRARKLDRASALAASARCRGLLAAARGDFEGALASHQHALVHHERVLIPLDHARTLLALGSTQRRLKSKRPARETLEAARAIFRDLGARIWLEKAEDELSRIGGRPAATRALTPTEQKVAALVAEGRSNKEVAAKLYVTVKTVEANLSRIYAKLGIRSRAELAHHVTSAKAEDSATKV
jgi:DNA-binding CsgD family transcriptional regulator